MERIDEAYGEGNAYDYGMRMYDPRIGRWTAMDPLQFKYPYLSPYVFVANKPIIAIDPDGRDIEVRIVGTTTSNNPGHVVLVVTNYVPVQVMKDGELVTLYKKDGSLVIQNMGRVLIDAGKGPDGVANVIIDTDNGVSGFALERQGYDKHVIKTYETYYTADEVKDELAIIEIAQQKQQEMVGRNIDTDWLIKYNCSDFVVDALKAAEKVAQNDQTFGRTPTGYTDDYGKTDIANPGQIYVDLTSGKHKNASGAAIKYKGDVKTKDLEQKIGLTQKGVEKTIKREAKEYKGDD